MVISRRLAKARDWQPGTLVAMRDRNGVPVSYEVLHVDDRAGFDGDERAFAIASPHWLRSDFCVPATCVSMVTLRLRADADPDQVGQAARAALPAVSGYKTGAWIDAYFRRDVGKDFRLFDILLGLMLVLAGVGLLNGMTIAMLGRERELGVLRALGIRRSALCGSFLLEGAVVAALASLLSCGLGALMATLLVLGMNQVAKLDAPVTLPWPWFALVPVLAFVTAVAAAALPAWRAVRASPAESVRYE
jgi:putative ABC transport system permease protein